MGWLLNKIRSRFEDRKEEVFGGTTVMMISGCEDSQTSADVSNVGSFQLPDPAGRAGGACTSVLLNILYADEQKTEEDLSFTEVLDQMRQVLDGRGYSQIPQLTSSTSIDVNRTFDLVPNESTGTRRALMIGINYVGHSQGVLSGCHNDVGNMKVRCLYDVGHHVVSRSSLCSVRLIKLWVFFALVAHRLDLSNHRHPTFVFPILCVYPTRNTSWTFTALMRRTSGC